ncbi:MAG: WXG100 family type VII secretion target [Lachnospiraceae bacterium]|nr:WXG100 family type VII secretion target [Lachnospiraceae bacterium]
MADEYKKSDVEKQIADLKKIRDDLKGLAEGMSRANHAVNEAWNGDNSEAFLDDARALRRHMTDTIEKLNHVIEMLKDKSLIYID